jgi:hypothetical protein
MPSSVAWFERLSYLSLILGLDAAILFYPGVNAYARATWPDVSQATILALYLLGLEIFVGFYGALIWLAARRRRSWGVWLIFGLTLLGLLLSPPILMQVLEIRDITDALNVASLVVQIVALALLSSKNARSWFKSGLANPASAERV